MTIEFVNHASFIADHDGIRLICDPWTEGTAFHNGWSLISPSKFKAADFDTITHIWFSHEHPDHFSPPNISKIPAEIRKKITVLYQETNDKKVVKWCREKGFKEVIELKKNAYYKLSDDFEIMNSSYLYGDSWLFIKTSEKTILNINDCVVNQVDQAIAISNAINSKVDILFTQFSYANYHGNKDQPELRAQAALDKIKENEVQINVFKPDIVVPFASYVWFSHEENFYMNDEINKVDRICNFLKTTTAKPVVMYPGDIVDFSQEHDSLSAVNRYMSDYDTAMSSALKKAEKVPLETLEQTAGTMSSKALKKFGKIYFKTKLRQLTPLTVYLTDHDTTISFSFLNGFKILKNGTPPDVLLSSEVLDYCLKLDFGFSTTHVNARMQAGGPDGYRKFQTYADLTNTINHDSFVPPNYYKLAVKKMLRILKMG